MGQKEEHICDWGGIEKRCRICKWDGRGNKLGYIRKNKFVIEEGSTNSAGFVNHWDRRKNKSVIGEELKNCAGFVNGTETNLAILGRTNL